jgi:hypothetical protein
MRNSLYLQGAESQMNIKTIGCAIALAALVGTGIAADRTPAQAQIAPAPIQYWERGGQNSDRNLAATLNRLDGLIGQLQGDQHDYGGYRVRAIAAMQQARADLDQALAFDRAHGH